MFSFVKSLFMGFLDAFNSSLVLGGVEHGLAFLLAPIFMFHVGKNLFTFVGEGHG